MENQPVTTQEATATETLPSDEYFGAEQADASQKSKRALRRGKRIEKLRGKLLSGKDIKYRGPLSYFAMRFLAWMAVAVSQFVMLNALIGGIREPFVSKGVSDVLSMFGDLSVPLFMIATFATILNKSRTYKSMMIQYVVFYLGIGLAFVVAYERYLAVFLNYMFDGDASTSLLAGQMLGKRFELNVFSDLSALSAFNFFLNYHPKKFFSGKKLIWFRLMMVLPLLFVVASYVLRVASNLNVLALPVEVYPFLTTKSPFIHLIFIFLSLWLKNRERLFFKLGATKEQFAEFETTNKNSLSFSVNLSVTLLVMSLVSFVLLFVLLIFSSDFETFRTTVDAYAVGEGVGLVMAVPFVMLFSYTRKTKNNVFDVVLPFVGIGMVVLTYVEVGYNLVLGLLAQ